ncbi:hypothetical protein [Dyella sp. C9]|uniref:hypothetical protein n=1 Tax=Dyella sp. C9 TaxID=2202154 RepID=UPI000DEFEB18|nr:hypothetical protein [Dyella sp. C9]
MRTDWFGEDVCSSQDIIDSYNSFIDSANSLNLLVRSSRLQQEKVLEIDEYIGYIKGFKHQVASRGDERFANLLFHFQCMLRCVQSSIRMWMHLKEDNHQKAWCCLVDAQEYKDVALKIEDHVGVRRVEEFLEKVRDTVFPPWTHYNSAAFTSTIGRCSICGKPFGDCDHVEGMVYLGRLCRRVGIQLLEANHCAIVSNPRDRRCIFAEISRDDGRMMNVFTLEDTGDVREKEEGVAGHVNGVILTTVSLDFD